MSDTRTDEEIQAFLGRCFDAVEKNVEYELDLAKATKKIVDIPVAHLLIDYLRLVSPPPKDNHLDKFSEMMKQLMTGEIDRKVDDEVRPIVSEGQARPDVSEHRYVQESDAVLERNIGGGYVVKVFNEVESKRCWPSIRDRETPEFLAQHGQTKQRTILVLALVYGPQFDFWEAQS